MKRSRHSSGLNDEAAVAVADEKQQRDENCISIPTDNEEERRNRRLLPQEMRFLNKETERESHCKKRRRIIPDLQADSPSSTSSGRKSLNRSVQKRIEGYAERAVNLTVQQLTNRETL